MERVCNKFSSFDEAEKYDIQYYITLSDDERQVIARELKKRVFGDQALDIRAFHGRK